MSTDYSELKRRPKITVRARGRGAGKTYEAVRWALSKALETDGVSIAVVGSGYDRESFLESIRTLATSLSLSFEYQPSQRKLTLLYNDSVIAFYEPDNPDSLRGHSHTYVVGENVQSWPKQTFFYTKALCRSKGEERPEMWMNFLGTESEYILDLLSDGFEASTN